MEVFPYRLAVDLGEYLAVVELELPFVPILPFVVFRRPYPDLEHQRRSLYFLGHHRLAMSQDTDKNFAVPIIRARNDLSGKAPNIERFKYTYMHILEYVSFN